ncbi:MAG: hypothetical protein ACFCVD_23540 [Nodosilinea sp.]
MKPENPNFPPEIPAIPPPSNQGWEPEPRSDETVPNQTWPIDAGESPESLTDLSLATGPGEHAAVKNILPASTGETSATTNLAEPISDIDYWLKTDPAEPTQSIPDPTEGHNIEAVEPIPSARRKDPTDSRPREAEKPVRIEQAFDDWAETEVPYQPKELGIIDQLVLILANGSVVWRRFLRWLRSQLPRQWQRRLSDDALAAIVLGVLMLLLALWNPLGAGRSKPAVAQVTLPRVEEVSPSGAVVALTPGSAPQEAETPEPEPPAASEWISEPALSTEQSLIADIQTQVSRISRSYQAGLIESVEVNLPENTLAVNVGENWYGLTQGQQDRVSQGIYDQVQELGFSTLNLRDPVGIIVARNPVVGSTMVVLHRSRSAAANFPAF